MSESVERLEHRGVDKKEDDTLVEEAHAHLAKSGPLQLVAELLIKLRGLQLPFWTPDQNRVAWRATHRMQWIEQRADLRQQITSKLTGLAPKAARRLSSDLQASLIDTSIDAGDITVAQFEEAYAPPDLVVYGPVREFWKNFRASMPWDQDTPVHQELVAWLLGALLADRSLLLDGLVRRTPILTPWQVRTAIEDRVWHTHLPVEIRVAIDRARFARERDQPGTPFHARDDFEIATPAVITQHIPLAVILPVMDVAERAMRFDPPTPAVETTNGVAAEPPAAAAVEAPTSGKTSPDATVVTPALIAPEGAVPMAVAEEEAPRTIGGQMRRGTIRNMSAPPVALPPSSQPWEPAPPVATMTPRPEDWSAADAHDPTSMRKRTDSGDGWPATGEVAPAPKPLPRTTQMSVDGGRKRK